jgi:hypothetical protein
MLDLLLISQRKGYWQLRQALIGPVGLGAIT